MKKMYECKSEFERNKMRDAILDGILMKLDKIEQILNDMKASINFENNKIDMDKEVIEDGKDEGKNTTAKVD